MRREAGLSEICIMFVSACVLVVMLWCFGDRATADQHNSSVVSYAAQRSSATITSSNQWELTAGGSAAATDKIPLGQSSDQAIVFDIDTGDANTGKSPAVSVVCVLRPWDKVFDPTTLRQTWTRSTHNDTVSVTLTAETSGANALKFPLSLPVCDAIDISVTPDSAEDVRFNSIWISRW